MKKATTDNQKNREIWLKKAVKFLNQKIFKPIGRQAPEVRVSVGFTGSKSGNKAIGSCWKGTQSSDKVAQIFISPIMSDSSKVLDILAHELIHAMEPTAGHKSPFRKVAIAIGLEGPMPATTASKELKGRLNAFIEKNGKYPHCSLDTGGSIGGKKKQGTRMLKAACPCCGYTVRITATWAMLGLPNCPLDDELLELDLK